MTQNEDITIFIDDIPEWLKDSVKYKSIMSSGNEQFKINPQFIIQSPNINWIEEFKM